MSRTWFLSVQYISKLPMQYSVFCYGYNGAPDSPQYGASTNTASPSSQTQYNSVSRRPLAPGPMTICSGCIILAGEKK